MQAKCHLVKSLAQIRVLYSSFQAVESLELDLDLQHCNFKWNLKTVFNKKIVTLWEFIFTSTLQVSVSIPYLCSP